MSSTPTSAAPTVPGPIVGTRRRRSGATHQFTAPYHRRRRTGTAAVFDIREHLPVPRFRGLLRVAGCGRRRLKGLRETEQFKICTWGSKEAQAGGTRSAKPWFGYVQYRQAHRRRACDGG